MAIEIVHQRDPDSECGFTVYVDGRKVSDAAIYSVDAGQGYEFSDWAASAYVDKVEVSPNVWADVLAECYADPCGAEYIDHFPDKGSDGAAWIDHLDNTAESRQWWAENLPHVSAPFLCDSVSPTGRPCSLHYGHKGDNHRADWPDEQWKD